MESIAIMMIGVIALLLCSTILAFWRSGLTVVSDIGSKIIVFLTVSATKVTLTDGPVTQETAAATEVDQQSCASVQQTIGIIAKTGGDPITFDWPCFFAGSHHGSPDC